MLALLFIQPLYMTLETILGFGACCPQGHCLVFPCAVLCSLAKRGCVFLSLAGVGLGWRSTEAFQKPGQLLKTEGRGFVSLPQTQNSLKEARSPVHLCVSSIPRWAWHTVRVQKMFVEPHPKLGSRVSAGFPQLLIFPNILPQT